MDNLYLILDESGNLHKNSKDRYFIIGGYLTNNALKARQLFKKELSTYKINNNLDNMVEIKGSMIKNYDKRNMLLSISNKMSKNNFYFCCQLFSFFNKRIFCTKRQPNIRLTCKRA